MSAKAGITVTGAGPPCRSRGVAPGAPPAVAELGKCFGHPSGPRAELTLINVYLGGW